MIKNRVWNRAHIIMLSCLMAFSMQSYAQFYSGSYNEFGKNRVQYDDQRVWRFYRFQSFDTYFYEEGKALAIYASSYAYEQLQELEQKLDFSLDKKIRIIVFKDLSDLKETNIGLITDVNYNIGGVTHIIDNKMFIYFNGDHSDFERQIRRGLAQLVFEQVINGGGIGSNIKNSYLLDFPAWYSNGLISFLADDWTTEIDLKVRDGILSEEYKRFDLLSEEEQAYVGHSVWKYIQDKYGDDILSEVVYMAKINRNIETGFLFVLGQTFDGLMEDWYEHYKQLYSASQEVDFQESGSGLLKRNKEVRMYQNLAVSSGGTYAAYTQNETGKVKLRLMDLSTGKTKTILKFGSKLNEKVDYSYPLLTWAPGAEYLAVAYEEKGKNVIEFYDAEEGEWTQKRYLMQLDKVLSLQYNRRGNQLIISAIIRGQSDLFLYFVGSNTFKRLTNDNFDDHYPTFVNNDEGIVFSSNRRTDTLKADVATNKHFKQDTVRGLPTRDLFYYNLTTNSPVLRRVTQTPLADEIYPQGLAHNQFCWVSDESGIYNRYAGRFDSVISYVDTTTHYRYYTKYYPVSNYADHVVEQDVNIASGKLSEIIYQDGHYRLFVRDLDQSMQQQESIYQSAFKTKQLDQIRKALLEKQRKAADTARAEKETTKPKSKPANNSSRRFRVVQIGSMENSAEADQREKQKKDETTDKSASQETASAQAPKQEEKAKADPNYNPFKATNYQIQYEISQLVSQVDFNYMNYSYQPYTYNSGPIFLNRGFNAFIKVGVMDMLEDKRIIGGVNISPDLRNNEYFISYTDLTKRLDKEYTFHRVLYETDNPFPGYNMRQFVHEGFYKLSWPFSNVLSLRTTFHLRNERTVLLAQDLASMEEEPYVVNRAGIKTELVFDATRSLGTNLYTGSRWKIFAEYFQNIEDYERNTFVAGFDFRKYFRIHKNLIWANRAAGSTSLGTDRLIYYMGGVDNWVNPKFNSAIQVDEDQNYVYQTLATNMRGFDQNIRNGNNFVAVNTEIRWPVFSYLSRKPIKNNFLNNFMMVGFFDVGTAWNGWNPFSDENALYRYTVNQPPVSVTIINQNEPLVAGYGFGARMNLFGYYIRLDWAWGIQNGYIGDRMFYLSLDLDF